MKVTSQDVVELDPNDVVVPGLYGAPWPLVTEPIDLEIGPCKITITIEDENAKMPLSWLVTSSKEANKQAENALKTFCEWMSWDQQQLRELETTISEAMDEVHKKKAFTLNPGPILLKSTTTRTARTPARTSRSRSRTSRRTASRTVRSTTTQKRPAVAHTTDFAKLFHSSLLDRELLARHCPTRRSGLKVLLNTCPFGGPSASMSTRRRGMFLRPLFRSRWTPLIFRSLHRPSLRKEKKNRCKRSMN